MPLIHTLYLCLSPIMDPMCPIHNAQMMRLYKTFLSFCPFWKFCINLCIQRTKVHLIVFNLLCFFLSLEYSFFFQCTVYIKIFRTECLIFFATCHHCLGLTCLEAAAVSRASEPPHPVCVRLTGPWWGQLETPAGPVLGHHWDLCLQALHASFMGHRGKGRKTNYCHQDVIVSKFTISKWTCNLSFLWQGSNQENFVWLRNKVIL